MSTKQRNKYINKADNDQERYDKQNIEYEI